MYSKNCKFKTALLTSLSLLSITSLYVLKNTKTHAQTQSVESQCTDVAIKKHIQQLNQAEHADFNALVACKSKAVPHLITTLKQQDENLRIITIAALGEIGANASPAVSILNDLLKNSTDNVRVIIVRALEQIGKDGVPSLIYALKNNRSWIVRYSAADALGTIDSSYTKNAIPVLIQALKDPDWYVRSKATDTLGKMGKAAVPALIHALKDKNWFVRYSAADALGKIGADAKNALPALKTALLDQDVKVRNNANYAIKQINFYATNSVNRQSQILSNQNQNISIRYEGIRERINCERFMFSQDRYREPDSDQICDVIIYNSAGTGSANQSITHVGGATTNYIRANPPVMCKIPAIKAVLRWKCP